MRPRQPPAEPLHPASARLIAKILECLPGDEPDAARLARAAGMGVYSDMSLPRKWMSGAVRPSSEYLVPMLSRAGLLHEAAVRAYWTDGDVRREVEASRRALGVPAAPDASARRRRGA